MLSKGFKKNVLEFDYEKYVPFLYLTFFYFVFFLIYFLGGLDIEINNYNVTRFDAGWYSIIKDFGYQWDPNKQSSVAFFPLFPYLWKFSCLDSIGISLVNAFIFAYTAYLFFQNYNLRLIEKIFLLSMPCLMFCYLPYTESLFFCFSFVLLLGLKKDNWRLIFLGILGIGLTRSVILTMLPCFLMLLVFRFKKNNTKDLFLFGSLILGAALLSLSLVISVQYAQTGELFGFHQTHTHWDHKLQWIKFPVHSWSNVVPFSECFSLLVGLWSGFEMLLLFLNKVGVLKNRNLTQIDLSEIFSLCYLFLMAVFVLFMQGDTSTSLNRYVLGSVYFWVFYSYYFKNHKKNQLVLGLILLGVLAITGFISLPGTFNSGKEFGRLYIFGAALYLPFHFYLQQNAKRKIVFVLCIIVCFIMQIHFLHHFLKGTWVG